MENSLILHWKVSPISWCRVSGDCVLRSWSTPAQLIRRHPKSYSSACQWFLKFSFFELWLKKTRTTFSFVVTHRWHMEVPRVGVQSELQLPAYTTAIATQDPSLVCDLHHSSRQRRILNSLSKARDWTRNHMVPTVPWWELQKYYF